jgi:hypothetical protein
MPSSSSDMRRGRAVVLLHWVPAGRLRLNTSGPLRFVPETEIRTRAELLYNQATAYCDVHDISTFANCLLAERAGVFEKLGRWDDCLSITHTMLEERSLSPANRMQPLCYQAKVMARRRQDGFWPHLDEAMDLALGLDEPEWLSFVGLARVEAYWLEGRLDAARAELDRVRDVSAGVVVLSRGWIALWTRRLTGIAEPIDLEPFASQIAGDGAHAAELWDRLARTKLGRILKVSPDASRKFSSFSRKANPMKRLQAACSFR